MPSDDRPQARGRLETAALAALLVAVALRALTPMDPFPGWDGDPFVSFAPSVGLTPTPGMVVDAVIAGAALALLWFAARHGRGAPAWAVAAAGAGAAVAAVHATPWFGGSLEHAPRGLHWTASMFAGLALARLPAGAARRLALAVLLGVTAPLVCKGVVQMVIEHPAVVASFDRDRAALLSARGWAEGSASALIYERRLTQAEATGWFGLANVYASFMATGVLAFGALALGAWRGGRDRAGVWTAGAAAAACGWGLLASGSKGGIGAVLLGGGLLLVGGLIMRWRRGWASVIGVLAVAAPLAAVAARGAIGTSWGELSLLFRAFYAEAALRIWGGAPVLGVGPERFQEAYARAKPALSPELVTSPHSVMLDWTSMLGLGGAAWSAVLVAAAWAMGRRTSRPGPTAMLTEPASLAAGTKFAGFIAAAVMLAGLALERAALTPEAAAARVIGCLGAVAIGWLVLRASPWGERAAALAAGLALLGHAQVELSGTHIGPAAWVLAMLGLAAGPAQSADAPEARSHGIRRWLLAVPAGAAVVLTFAVPGVGRWESALAGATAEAAPIGAAAQRFRAAAAGGDAAEVAGAVAAVATLGDGLRISTGDDVSRVLNAARQRAWPGVGEALGRAVAARPEHMGTREAFTRVLLERGLGERRVDLVDTALAAVDEGTRVRPGSATAWAWAATVRLTLAEVGWPAEAGVYRAEAARALEAAAAADPGNARVCVRLVGVYSDLGDAASAARWGAEALRRDGLTRLDPLAGLSDAEERAARAAAGP